ncbi:hypothetical protein [Nocardia sp. CY41]|uniref:hypothetical protein n=1 Tax=Nocardia sp. CY41 TaxID=2608686 RepID=UPI00135A4E0C|nr:hypothetical protein [Nocardia sp. CY41]
MAIAPCQHPDCRDVDGNPRLTHDGICEGCQRRTARLLSRLVTDWVHLHVDMPTPPRRKRAERTSRTREYGHPAEWASVTAAQIARALNEIHADLTALRGETLAPDVWASELVRVRAAWTYLEPRTAELAALPDIRDRIVELRDLHGQIRSRLGLTKPRQILPAPCPACELRTLLRTIEPHNDQIQCGNCGHLIQNDHYEFYTRVILDTILEKTPENA